MANAIATANSTDSGPLDTMTVATTAVVTIGNHQPSPRPRVR